MRKSIGVGAGAVLLVIVIVVISELTGGKVTRNPSEPVSELVGHHVKGFTLGGLAGGTIKAPWETGRPSVLVFFASYCVPCQGEMPLIAKYIRSHSPSPVVVLAVDALDERSSAQSMVKRDGVTFPVAFDPNGVVTTGIFGFAQIPESVFVNSKGVVERVFYGAIPQRQLASGIKMLESTRT